MGRQLKYICNSCNYSVEIIEGGTMSAEMQAKVCSHCKIVIDKVIDLPKNVRNEQELNEMLDKYKHIFEAFVPAKDEEHCTFCRKFGFDRENKLKLTKDNAEEHSKYHYLEIKKMFEKEIKETETIQKNKDICHLCSNTLKIWNKSTCPKCTGKMQIDTSGDFILVD